MKTTVALLGVALAAVAQGAELPAGTDTSMNYARNGSFELGRDNFDYDGWQNHDPTGWAFSITNVASHGKRALFVEKGGAGMGQYVMLDPGTYVFAVSVRANPGTEYQHEKGKPTKGLGLNYGANFRFEKGGKETRLTGALVAGCPKDGTPKWEQLVSEPLTFPTNIYGKAYVPFGPGLKGTKIGSGIVDDIRLYKVRSEK